MQTSLDLKMYHMQRSKQHNIVQTPNSIKYILQQIQTRMWDNARGTMPNVMAALPNMGGALCSTPQFG